MSESFELRKARLGVFITELEDLIEGQNFNRYTSRLEDILEDAHNELADLEEDGE